MHAKPFGHRLSYTKFKIENKIIFDSQFIINSKVTNIGKKPGKTFCSNIC